MKEIGLIDGGKFALGLLSGVLLSVFSFLILDLFDIRFDERFNSALLGALLGATIGFAAQMLKITMDENSARTSITQERSSTATSVQVKMLQALTSIDQIGEHFKKAKGRAEEIGEDSIANLATGLPATHSRLSFSDHETFLGIDNLSAEEKFDFVGFADQYNYLIGIAEKYFQTREVLYSEFRTSKIDETADLRKGALFAVDLSDEDKGRFDILMSNLNGYAATIIGLADSLYGKGAKLIVSLAVSFSKRSDINLNFLSVEYINEKLKELELESEAQEAFQRTAPT